MFDSLQPHGLQHSRLPCPSPTPRACSNSWQLSWWCHPTISSSLMPFSCPHSFPASGSFAVSCLFASGGQSSGASASASASILPTNIQDWFPLWLTGLISLQSKGLSRVFFNTTVQKHWFFGTQLSLCSNSHTYMTTEKNIALTRWTFVGKVMSLLSNMLSRLVIAFLPRSKHLLISWLQSAFAEIWEPKKRKSSLFPLFLHLFAKKWGVSTILLTICRPYTCELPSLSTALPSTTHLLPPWCSLNTLSMCPPLDLCTSSSLAWNILALSTGMTVLLASSRVLPKCHFIPRPSPNPQFKMPPHTRLPVPNPLFALTLTTWPNFIFYLFIIFIIICAIFLH